eukprot:GEMP01001047.1.p1 GENE.GEMP01001047.1~~GEMP01001047.1.p1  ORF type:complete len:1122 (+),score=132.56 GEMP01001047.1:77-3442(+)
MTSCRKPNVDPPTCLTPYSHTNLWFEASCGTVQVGCLVITWYCWYSLFQVTRSGLPRAPVGVQLVLTTLLPTLLSLYLLDPLSLRRGSWFGVISVVSEYLMQSIWVITGAIVPLASLRISATTLQGKQGFVKGEFSMYVFGSTFALMLATPCIIVEVYARVHEVSAELLLTCDYVRLSGCILLCTFCSLCKLMYINSFRDEPRFMELLSSHKIQAYSVLLSQVFVAVYAFDRETPEGLLVDHTVLSTPEQGFQFAWRVSFYAMTALRCARVMPRIKRRCGLMGKLNGTREKHQWIFSMESISSAAVIIFLSLSVYVPALLPFHTMQVFLEVLMLLPGFVFVLFASKTSHVTDECLSDLSVAAFLRCRTTFLGAIKFYAPGVKLIIFDFLLYTDCPFSRFAKGSSVGFRSLSIFEWTQDYIDHVSVKVRSASLVMVLIVYHGWSVASFIVRLFPLRSHRANKVYLVVSLGFFAIAPLAMRLLLGGIKCQAGTLVWNGSPCDKETGHAALHIIVVYCTTWLICVASLHFSAFGRLKLDPLLVQNPSVAVRQAFLKLCVVFSAVYLPPTPHVFTNLAIVALATAQQFHKPLIVGRTRLSAFRSAILMAALSINMHALIPDFFTVPMMCVHIVIAILAYKVAYRRLSLIAVAIEEEVKKANEVDFTQPDLRPRLLGICLHTPRFATYLRVNLVMEETNGAIGGFFSGVRQISNRAMTTLLWRDSSIVSQCRISSDVKPGAVAPEPAAMRHPSTSQALMHLTSAISAECSKTVLLRSPEYVSIMPRWLLSPHRAHAIRCVCAMTGIEGLHEQLRAEVMESLLTTWRLVENAEHIDVAKAILKIRGSHKIIVTFGQIQRIRRIAIPHRVVWLVPHASSMTADDPMDAVLTFPPVHNLPSDGLPSNLPHLAILTGQWSPHRASFATVRSESGRSLQGASSIVSWRTASIFRNYFASRQEITKGGGSGASLGEASPQISSITLPRKRNSRRVSNQSVESLVPTSVSLVSTSISRISISSVARTSKAFTVALRTFMDARLKGPRKVGGPYILFRLGDDSSEDEMELPPGDDGVPTHRLREELTAFYANQVRPCIVHDEGWEEEDSGSEEENDSENSHTKGDTNDDIKDET